MAAPNVLALLTITAKSVTYRATGSLVDALANAAASGLAYRVNMIQVANNDAAATYTADVVLLKSGGSARYLAKAVNLPAGVSIVVLDRPLTLEEGDSIQALGSTTLKVDVVISYDVLSST